MIVENIKSDIYSVPFVKPLNVKQIKEIAEQYSEIIVLEEHQKKLWYWVCNY